MFFCLIEPEAILLNVLTFQTSPDGNVTVSTLVFIPTIKDAGKFVGCRAADMLTGEGSLEDGWELTITCKENIVNTWSDIIRHKYLPTYLEMKHIIRGGNVRISGHVHAEGREALALNCLGSCILHEEEK